MEHARYTAFLGHKEIAKGTEADLIAELAPRGAHPEGLLIFDDATGRVIDLDLTGAAPRPRGRPKLGVKAREVTLLPRHWDWLSRQRGGASAALRRMIEDAMRADQETPRDAADRCFRFLTEIAGDLPQFEAAIRALYAGEKQAFYDATNDWPQDIVAHAKTLARQMT